MHLSKRLKRKAKVVYPACNVDEFMLHDLENREPTIVSYAQFRHEKRHWFQIEAFSRFVQLCESGMVGNDSLGAKQMEFAWSEPASEVFISTSWFGWEKKIKLEQKADQKKFSVSLLLPRGKHAYKFFVDGAWRIIASEATETDEFGNVNNIATNLRSLTTEEKVKLERMSKFKLMMIGNASQDLRESAQIVQECREMIKANGLENRIEIIFNEEMSRFKKLLGKAALGLHTMVDEHFGIAIVEMVCSGLFVIAHDSAGPKLDILSDD